MPYGFQRITDLSSIGLKTLNDQLEMIWLKLMGGVDYNESSGELKNVVDTVTDGNNIGSYFAQTNEGITLAAGAVGTNNLLLNGDATNDTNNWEIENGTLSVVIDTYGLDREVFELRGSETMTFSQRGIACNPAIKHTLSFKGLLAYPATDVKAYVRGKKDGTDEYYEHRSVTVTPGVHYEDYYVSFETYTDESELEVIFEARMAEPYALFYATDIQIKEGGALSSFSKNNKEQNTNMFMLHDDGMHANVTDIQIEETDSAGETNLIINQDAIGSMEMYSPKMNTLGKDVMTDTDTLFVSTDGSDDNDGSLYSPFRTIQKAIDSLPLIINEPMIIYVFGGTYYEDILIRRKNLLVHLIGLDDVLLIGSITIFGGGYIRIETMDIQTTGSDPCINIYGSGVFAYLYKCVLDGVSKNSSGLSCEYGSQCYLEKVNIFNTNYAIAANKLGSVFFKNVKGDNNNISLYSLGGIITGTGYCPSASTLSSLSAGGKVFYTENNMGTETYPLTNVLAYTWKTYASSSATLIDGVFDQDAYKLEKGKTKKFINAFGEKIYGPERTAFWFFSSDYIVSKMGSKTIFGARFKIKRNRYGGDPKPSLIALFLHDVLNKNATNEPAFYDTGVRARIACGEIATIFLPADAAELIANGTYKGIAVKALSDDEDAMIFTSVYDYTTELTFYYN